MSLVLKQWAGNNRIRPLLLRMVAGFDLHNCLCLRFSFSPLQSETIIIVYKLQSDVASVQMSPCLCQRGWSAVWAVISCETPPLNNWEAFPASILFAHTSIIQITAMVQESACFVVLNATRWPPTDSRCKVFVADSFHRHGPNYFFYIYIDEIIGTKYEVRLVHHRCSFVRTFVWETPLSKTMTLSTHSSCF